ncbi:MAG: hypothetical protein LBG69_01365 [Zoogloeaceae bacterium]|jgi:hypothetical protein|nr:hypothetical protein [Zoogloeaceae bacterium]
MKKCSLFLFAISFSLSVCAQDAPQGGQPIKIKITAGAAVLTATLIDNATSRAFYTKLPLTVPMQDLYHREMRHHFPDALPTDDVRTTG